MRIFLLGNNQAALRVIRWLAVENESITGLAVHGPNSNPRFVDEIVEASGVEPDRVFDGAHLGEPAILEAIAALEPDLAISVFFGYLLKDSFLKLFRGNAINLHPGYLPYNRGTMPNVWSIVEQTPAGATLHYIDAGVDTGDIIAQRRVAVEPIDTGETLYSKLEDACVDLFRDAWPLIKAGKARRTPQSTDEGTYHRSTDVQQIDRIDPDGMYTARDLLNVLRARTFPPHQGAHFEIDGRQVYVRVELSYGSDLPPSPDEAP